MVLEADRRDEPCVNLCGGFTVLVREPDQQGCLASHGGKRHTASPHQTCDSRVLVNFVTIHNNSSAKDHRMIFTTDFRSRLPSSGRCRLHLHLARAVLLFRGLWSRAPCVSPQDHSAIGKHDRTADPLVGPFSKKGLHRTCPGRAVSKAL